MRGRSPRVYVRPAASPASLAARAAMHATAPHVTGTIAPFSVPLTRGPYQNNGATPWYGRLGIGTPGQGLKIALDTGANFIWVTSTLCGPTGCQHYGNGQFNYRASSSFSWINQTPIQVSFGPWGSMNVETGKDDIRITAGGVSPFDVYLATSYASPQFQELDWDGGIGIPSGSAYADPNTSFSIAELMNAGLMDPTLPYVSFLTDQATAQGVVSFGSINTNVVDPYSAIYLPWTPYTAFPGVEYIWTTPLNQYYVGESLVAANAQFCLDSGSSQFKGDNTIMNTTLQLLGPTPAADVLLVTGTAVDGGRGEILVPPSVYMQKIEAGPDQGQVLPQFNPLGLTGLVLVGSVLMDQLSTTYVYDVTDTVNGYTLAPVGMWIFNKKNGPQLIQSKSSKPFTMTPRPVHQG